MYKENKLSIINTYNGLHVYVNNNRIHHWMPGLILVGLGFLGLLFNDNKENNDKYIISSLLGGLLILDDFKDFDIFLKRHASKSF